MMKRKVKIDGEIYDLIRDAYNIDIASARVVFERIFRDEEIIIMGPDDRTDIQVIIEALRVAIRRLQSIDEVRRARQGPEDYSDAFIFKCPEEGFFGNSLDEFKACAKCDRYNNCMRASNAFFLIDCLDIHCCNCHRADKCKIYNQSAYCKCGIMKENKEEKK